MTLTRPVLEDLTPYLGLLLLKAGDAEPDEAFARRLSTYASDVIAEGAASLPPTMRPQSTFDVRQPGVDRPWIGGFIYEKNSRPAWWSGAPDEWSRHLVLVASKGGFGAVCTSDAALRERFGSSFTPLKRAEMSRAFIGARASTVWFNGIHAPSLVKPDAKMLSGQALEFAIDPLGDQTYYVSALRSRPVIAGLSVSASPPAAASSSPSRPRRRPADHPSVGVAPDRSRIWLGAARDWAQFEERLDAVLAHLSVATDQTPIAFGKLAQEVDSGVVFKDAYAMALMPPELLDDEVVADEEALRVARLLVDDLKIDLIPGTGGAFTAATSIESERLATLDFTITDDQGVLRPSLAVSSVPARSPGAMADRATAATLVKTLKRMARAGDFKVYFDAPVTVVGSRIFRSTFDDRKFAWTPRSFAGFDIHREKPWVIDASRPGTLTPKNRRKSDRTLVDAILAEDDNSLFDWVRSTYTKGHLLCDDGSMEVADFVHLAEDQTLTLIHAKAAGAKNMRAGKAIEVSVSDFEVVTAQAIKNLRHLDGSVLAARIKGRKPRAMDEAIWLDGRSARTREVSAAQAKKLFVTALSERPAGSRTQVIILQPRVTETELEFCRKNPLTDRAARMRQLDALMLATEHIMRGWSAELVAYHATP